MHQATRRSVLAAGAMALPALAAGCKGFGALGTPPRPLPDVGVARRAIAGESLMIARYEAVLAAVPGLASRLSPLLAQHRDHLARLRRALIAGSQAARPSPAGARGAPRQPAVPGTPAAAVAYLRESEQTAAASLLGQVATVSPSFAQLLTSVAASEATHALVLGAHGPLG